ncbi:uncharacterized protein [Amphiura filiformis]|uniref:uncharacterized protein isoform X2 n=1 Tax=Amphiura filiformis TaxID=82378 RepID=UPI003B20CE58
MATTSLKENTETQKEQKEPLQLGETCLAGDSNAQYNHDALPKTISAKLKDFSPFWKAVITLLVLFAVFGLIISLLLRPEGNMSSFARLPNVPNCGLHPQIKSHSRANRYRRIVGGTPTKEGALPWTVFISPSPKSDYKVGICGGVLLNEHWVLTAAHCIYQYNQYNEVWMRYQVEGMELVMGTPYKNATLLNKYLQKRTVEKVYVHPLYFTERTIQNYDFAMIKVTKPFILNTRVSPVCIAQPEMDFPPGMECVIGGWGSTSNIVPILPVQQRSTWIPLVSNEECVEFTQTITKRLVPYVTPEKLCAGYIPDIGKEGHGACEGDSGSGLVCEGADGRWYAVGLVSVGRKCGEISFYTRLSEMVDFVAQVLGDNPPPVDMTCANESIKIWPEQICDGRNDCKDFSDEQNCECTDKQFRCDNGLCKFAYTERCDNVDNCGDGSDERNCTYFECDNGTKKMTLNNVCDGDFDCLDLSDESTCECSAGQFRCNNTLCRPLSWRCDGKDDCTDGSDEYNCECTETSFRCNNSRCVPHQNVCDLMDNCGDFSDEDYCNCIPGYVRCDMYGFCIQKEHEEYCKGFEDYY